jgi:hypothetical protein
VTSPKGILFHLRRVEKKSMSNATSLYDRKIRADLKRAHILLDELEANALEYGEQSAIAVARAARALARYIEGRQPALRESVGHSSMLITADVELARRKLKAWIAHLQETMHVTTPLAS